MKRLPDCGRGKRPETTGFSLLELVATVAILALLAGLVVPLVAGRVAATRDARRAHDILLVRDAIEQFKLDTGEYPVGAPASSWDTSEDGEFLKELVDGGYLADHVLDPLNDATHHFRYFRYARGQYGCVGPGQFYVLGIRAFESPGFDALGASAFQCSGRDWGREFAYVTGGGARHD